MKILSSLLAGLALAGPTQEDTVEMCGGVSNFSLFELETRISTSKRTRKLRSKFRGLKVDFEGLFDALFTVNFDLK